MLPLRLGSLRRCAARCALLGALASPLAAQTTLYWDGDGSGTVAGGSGTWSTSHARWSTTSNGTTYQVWANGTNTANFSGATSYSVTLGSDITAGQITGRSITINPNGYTLTLGLDDANVNNSPNIYLNGSGNLVKTGTSTLTLDSLNDHTGNTEVRGGVLAAVGSALGRGTLIFAGGTVQALDAYSLGTKAITINSGGGTLDTNGFSATHSGVIAGSGTFTKSGTGTLTLSGTNTWTGGLVVANGTVQLGNSGTVLADTLAVTVNSGTFRVGTANETIGSLAGTGGIVDLNNGAGRTLTVGGDNTSTSYAGVIQGTAGVLAKTGTGTLTLTGTNTYTGGTTLSGGTLALGSSGALGTTGTITFSGGTLQYSPSNTTDYSSRFSTAANQAYSIAVPSGVNGVVLATALTSSGGTFAKSGAGTLTLSGANTYSGGTTVSAGTLLLGNAQGVGTTGTVTVASGATFDTAAYGFDLARLAGTGTALGTGAGVFSHSSASNQTLGLALNSSSLAKSGTGTLTLTGANSHGGITVSGGTLALSGSGNLISGQLHIDNGATLDLGSTTGSWFGAVGAFDHRVVGNITGGTLYSSGGIVLQSGTTTATFNGSGTDARLWIGGDANAVVTLNGTNNLVFTVDHSSVIIGYAATGNAGTVRVGNPNALLGTEEIAQVVTGKLDLNGVSGVRGAGITLFGTNAVSLVNNNTASGGSFAGQILMAPGGLPNIGGSGDLVLSGWMRGSGGFNKTGSGSLTLSGSNTYTGGTTLTSGALVIGNDNALGYTGSFLTINGGALRAWGAHSVFNPLTVNSSFELGRDLNLFGSLTINGSPTITLANPTAGSGTTTLSGQIFGSGTLTFAAGTNAPSQLILSGHNASSFSGSMLFSGGNTLIAGNSLGTGRVFLRDNATLELASTLSIGGVGTAALPSVGSIIGGGLYTNSGQIFLQSGLYTATFSGISGLSRLWIGGDANATVLLNGTNNGTYFDRNQVLIGHETTGAAGTVRIGNANALAAGSENVFVFSGALDLNGVSDVRAASIQLHSGGASSLLNSNTSTTASFGNTTLLAAGNSPIGGAGNLTLSGPIIGGGGILKTGAGTLTLSGANDSSGGLTLAGGVVAASANTNLGASWGTVTFNGGTLRTTADFTAARDTTLGTGGGIFDVASSTTLTWNGAITGAAGNHLTKIGTGTLVLGGANTYGGDTLVNAGTLRLGAASALSPNTHLIVASGATFDANGFAPTYANLSGTGSINVGSGGIGVAPSGTANFTGTLTGSGGLTMSGTGTLTLGNANTFAGNTSVSSGTLRLGAAGALPSGTPVAVASGATLDLNGHAAAVGRLEGAGTISNGGAQLTVTQTGNSTFSGALGGTGGLIKSGGGTLTLTGTNTFSGATAINGGRLVLNGSAANSAFTVNAGGTLSGSGTVGTLTIASGGILSPGNSPGILSAGATTFAAGGSLVFELNSATGSAGTNWDLLSISGALNIAATSGNTFTLSLTSLTLGNVAGQAANFDPAANYSFTFARATTITGFAANAFTVDTSAFQNAFGGVWSVNQSGGDLTLNYTGMSVVPEPSTYALWAGGAMLGAAVWRRRKRKTAEA